MDGFNAMQMLSSSSLLLSTESEPEGSMLSFSSSSEPELTISFQMSHDCFHHRSGERSMHGPFTSAQWMELEHQALIYNYISSNVPIPMGLLRKSLHLGWSHSSDPEPGRCRRTDGKKWRCSRDAVAEQKYCERHVNRGRHRSRKPVEGHAPGKKGSPIASAPSAAARFSGYSAQEFGAVSSEPLVNPSQKECRSVVPVLQSNEDDWSPLERGVGSMGGPLGEAITNRIDGKSDKFGLPLCNSRSGAESRHSVASSPISL